MRPRKKTGGRKGLSRKPADGVRRRKRFLEIGGKLGEKRFPRESWTEIKRKDICWTRLNTRLWETRVYDCFWKEKESRGKKKAEDGFEVEKKPHCVSYKSKNMMIYPTTIKMYERWVILCRQAVSFSPFFFWQLLTSYSLQFTTTESDFNMLSCIDLILHKRDYSHQPNINTH